MRICIATLTGYFNYGNRLQNFALQEALERIGGGRVDTLWSEPQPTRWEIARRRARYAASDGVGRTFARLARKVADKRGETPSAGIGQRPGATKSFVEEYIHQTESAYTHRRAIQELRSSYDYFVVGSDQVWNPNFEFPDHLRFLTFAERQQRIAYGASFGVQDLPSDVVVRYRAGISGIEAISVREEHAMELVSGLTGLKRVPVVLDPTMLLDPAEWESLARVPTSLAGGGYVGEFFLGTATGREMLPVQQFAADRNLDRVDLRSDTPEDLATMGPLEFIGAIKASSLLVTDSFHAAAFATIFRVPYLLKGRGAMNSRFDTLLSKSGLSMPKWGTLKELEASIEIDWGAVHQNIVRERADSLDYLRTALSLPTGK